MAIRGRSAGVEAVPFAQAITLRSAGRATASSQRCNGRTRKCKTQRDTRTWPDVDQRLPEVVRVSIGVTRSDQSIAFTRSHNTASALARFVAVVSFWVWEVCCAPACATRASGPGGRRVSTRRRAWDRSGPACGSTGCRLVVARVRTWVRICSTTDVCVMRATTRILTWQVGHRIRWTSKVCFRSVAHRQTSPDSVSCVDPIEFSLPRPCRAL